LSRARRSQSSASMTLRRAIPRVPAPQTRPSIRAKARNTRPWVIPVMTQHYTKLQRNLLYTGVTQEVG
jgi:hypothetical protein